MHLHWDGFEEGVDIGHSWQGYNLLVSECLEC